MHWCNSQLSSANPCLNGLQTRVCVPGCSLRKPHTTTQTTTHRTGGPNSDTRTDEHDSHVHPLAPHSVRRPAPSVPPFAKAALLPVQASASDNPPLHCTAPIAHNVEDGHLLTAGGGVGGPATR
jgi:hypothetical protein